MVSLLTAFSQNQAFLSLASSGQGPKFVPFRILELQIPNAIFETSDLDRCVARTLIALAGLSSAKPS